MVKWVPDFRNKSITLLHFPWSERECCLIGGLLLAVSPPNAFPLLAPAAATRPLCCTPEWAMNAGEPAQAPQMPEWQAAPSS